MSGRAAAVAGAGLALVAPVLGLVIGLFTAVVRPAREIARYVRDIETHATGIVSNLEGAAELQRTRDLANTLPTRAGALLAAGEPESGA
ncbi:MAG: hypothetical protein H0U32_05640 [Thermoleophilaceae bacterium]|nr:hypothetical protein [Thermoleophilaceae bacterium]